MILQYGNIFLAFLPFLFPLLLFIFFVQDFEWRESFLLSSVIWGTAVVTITEGLSIFNQLTYPSLSIAWIILDILAGSVLLNKAIKAGLKPIQLKFPHLERFEYFIIAGILIIILTTGVIAFGLTAQQLRFNELPHEPHYALDPVPKCSAISHQYNFPNRLDTRH